ncbi:hypothetical protein KC340_g1795 [Hortaea werneckii]|nr:hypothetical protein KC342_g606 [Hortaea werneckii]KAI7107905.1 hypothetical protein KC339_g1963 [Hortaea werneckii]KAI7220697.1 hypothetical protein KC365_g11921 [Hortaea werneckii]KAI7336122.1 hypothetical protein KC340_g1795 [Hortaea werneckii]KAI7406642.1 hypothetical protein KC328_g858 [Hortaea werneckii]
MPEQSEDSEVLVAAAILMRMHRAEGPEPGEESSATVTPALRGAHHGAVNNAMGLHWEPQRFSQATGSLEVHSMRQQQDREMMDVGETGVYKNDHAEPSGIFEGQKPGEVYRPQPQPLTYYIPTGNGGREQRTIPRFVGFHNAESILDADETRRFAGWRRESSWGAAGLRSGAFWRGNTKDYDDYIAAQHVNYADLGSGQQFPMGIPVERSNLWLPDQIRTQQSVSSCNNRYQGPNSVREGCTRQ